MSILILAEYNENILSSSTSRLVGAAKKIGGEIDVLIVGDDVKNLAQQLAKIAGVNKVLLANDRVFKHQKADVLCKILKDIIIPYSHFFASSNSVGKAVIPRLAAELDFMPISDVMFIHSKNKFDRPIYAGNAIETISTKEKKILATIRSSAFVPVEQGNDAKIENVKIGEIKSKVEFIKSTNVNSDKVDLSTAAIVVAGGQAFESKENFQMLYELADVLNAGVGATRAAVDLGFAPNEMQIGVSGKIIAPELYIAIGISGALQHLAGISGAKKIIAINSDADAPMMKQADVALVGDLKTILPELIKKLAQ